jgi:hypothetical protein
MLSLAFLWFQLQMTQQYLREEICPPAEVRAHSANLDASTGIGTLRRTSIKQVAQMDLLQIGASASSACT